MLKELKDIWEYVKTIKSDVESFIVVPNWEFYIFELQFDWSNFTLKNDIKQWDKDDLLRICFKPWKWRASALLPNVYVGDNLDWFVKIKETLNSLKNDFDIIKDLVNEYIMFSDNLPEDLISNLKQKLELLPKKDLNKKMVMSIISLTLSKSFIQKLWLSPLFDKEYLSFWEIWEFKNYFVLKNQWEWAKINFWFCHVCENLNKEIINFPESTWVNFAYKFYNLNKPWFAYDLDDKVWYKSFWICKDCFLDIQTWYNYFKTNLWKNVLGSKCYIVPSQYTNNNHKIYDIIEKYSHIDELELEIKDKITDWKLSKEMFEIFFDSWKLEEKELLSENNLVKFNFIFWSIDWAKSDELKIQYFLKDIIPSKLSKYYSSIKPYKKSYWEKKITDLIKELFGNNPNIARYYETLPDLHLYPTFDKNKYIWNLKEFFKTKGWDQSYYNYLDTVLHWNVYPIESFWSIVYEKLKSDFTKQYILSKKWNLRGSIWEIFIVYDYLINNNILNSNLKQMEKINFDSKNPNIEYLQTYFEKSKIFDSFDKIYVALVGFYVKLFIMKQKKEVGSNPFITQIDFERLDYNWLMKLLNAARWKFNKYSDKKFAYYPELYRLILEMSMNLNNELSRDEIVYFFSIWMEILPWVYWQDYIKEWKEIDEVGLITE